MKSNQISVIPTPCGAGFAMPSAARALGGHLFVAADRERKAGLVGAGVDFPATATRIQGTQVWSPPT